MTVDNINLHNQENLVSVPTGTILISCCADANGNPVIPTGYLHCDGRTYTKEQYPDLYYYLDGEDGVFSVPDIRECALVGVGKSSRNIPNHDEFKLGQFKDDQIRQHTHEYITTNNNIKCEWANRKGADEQYDDSETQTISDDSDNNISRYGSVTRGKRIGVCFIIKV